MNTQAPDRLLRVDLTEETVDSEPVPERWLRQFVGGKGLGARYLYEELDAGVDPLGPENVLVFMLGPLSGLVPGESRYAAITKSPHTGTFLDSYSGGTFPGSLVGSLDDHIGVLVSGAADRPVYLAVGDGTATIEPAEELWERDVVETCAAFPDAAVACVGPAGERRVTYATIATDGGDHHAGRGGAGAVMGAKRLKAVVAFGEPPEPPESLFEQYAERFSETDVGRWQGASETLETVDFADEVGVLPTRGWQEGSFDGAEGIGIEAVREASDEREREDDALPGGFRIDRDGEKSVPRGSTPISLGAGLGIDDFDAVAALGSICDRLGMDVISGGNAVAWAIRASEEGIVDEPITFGDEDAARELLVEIAGRTSELGDALADGVDAATAQYGGADLIPTVKRMEAPAYDPRGSNAMALAYATSDRGACHRRARPVESEVFAAEPWSAEDRARAVVAEQNARSVLWSLIVDDFVGEAFRDDLGAEWLAAVSRDDAREDLATVGERIWTLIRLFNYREGFSREHDSLPDRFTRPLERGPADGRSIDRDAFDRMLTAYYRQRGWDEEGVPTAETRSRLGLASLTTPTDEERPSPDTTNGVTNDD